MIVKTLALLVFVIVVGTLLRLAMGLRKAKTLREEARAAEEAQGRRVIAEIPVSEAEVLLLVEDESSFRWGTQSVAKADIAGGRLLLNGAVAGEFALSPGTLPAPSPALEFEGREVWEVVVYRRSGGLARISCGSLREGISREIGGRVFAVIRTAAAGGEGGEG